MILGTQTSFKGQTLVKPNHCRFKIHTSQVTNPGTSVVSYLMLLACDKEKGNLGDGLQAYPNLTSGVAESSRVRGTTIRLPQDDLRNFLIFTTSKLGQTRSCIPTNNFSTFYLNPLNHMAKFLLRNLQIDYFLHTFLKESAVIYLWQIFEQAAAFPGAFLGII